MAEVADELYGLTPAEFTAAREERARAARAAGRSADAAAIRKLARPTTSAWLVNQLGRDAAGRLGRLFEVAEALQEAQRTLAGDRLRELSAQRRHVVTDLVPVAAGLAAEAGQRASAAVLAEVRATLEAALADEGARDAVRSGRLTKALSYAGLGEVDLTAAVAVPTRKRPGRGGPESPAGPQEREPTRAERAAAALTAAESAVASAAAAVAQAEAELAAVGEQRQFLQRRISHLERELTQARDADAGLDADARQARQRRDEAGREHAAAVRRVDQARRAARRGSPGD